MLPPQAVGQAALDLLQLRFDRGIEVAARVSKITAPSSRDGSAITSTLAEALFWRRLSVTSAACAGWTRTREISCPLQFFESAQDQAVQRFGIDGEFAAQDPAGDGEGQLDQVGLGLGAQAGAQAADFLDGPRQPVDDRLQFGGGALAARPLRPRARRRRALRARAVRTAAATARVAPGNRAARSVSTPVRAGPEACI